MHAIKAVLNEWEAQNRTECWHIVWSVYRETNWLYQDLPYPETAMEWIDLRRWAKRYIGRHGKTPNEYAETYRALKDATGTQYGDICHYLDAHEAAQLDWPIPECPRPDTPELRTAAMRMLLMQPDRVMSQP